MYIKVDYSKLTHIIYDSSIDIILCVMFIIKSNILATTDLRIIVEMLHMRKFTTEKYGLAKWNLSHCNSLPLSLVLLSDALSLVLFIKTFGYFANLSQNVIFQSIECI